VTRSMQKLLLYTIVGILTFSTICSQWSIQDDVKFNTADLAEESEGEIEDVDIRFFLDQFLLRDQTVRSNDRCLGFFSEELRLFNFLEVAIPPPKR
jgi:hypothetical protein